MKLIVDKILWGILLLLFGPSVIIVASWNALPGDNLYGTKLALERAALTITSPSYATASTLQIKYTERRFAEAKQLLASKQSIQGLPYLQEQIVETKKAIEQAPNKETQVALAKQYINTLSTVSTELEAQKQSITTTSPQAPLPSVASTKEGQPTPTNTPTRTPTGAPTSSPSPTNIPTPIQIAQVTTTTPVPAQQAAVALQIDQTQQNVNQAITDLQALVETQGFQEKPPELTEEEKKERERWGTHSKEKRRKKIDDVPRILQEQQEEERDSDNDR